MAAKLYIETVGCQMNVLDSELVVGALRRQGYELADQPADAQRHEVEASFESYDPLRDPSMRPSPFQAYVRIQIGCDKFCTYCIVPSVRGPEQGRHPQQIAAEVRQLAAEGCKEITLLGQTVNSYEYDLGDGRRERLADLLLRIHDTPGLERIKFITNFPRDMADDLLDAVRTLPKVMPYLHVPAQSGDNEMLRRMERLY